MDLVESYLKAVAAQLPKATRDDIVAELRDEIMGRLEALEERLGRAPSDDEVEALLREVGHPLTVAARYRAGPQALIGPELYPWWLFAVKTALLVMACVTLIGLVVRVFSGDLYAGQAIGQAFGSLFSGAMTVIGVLTLIGFVLERQEKKPDFIAKWRVKDLGLFELGGDIDAETWGERLARGGAASGAAKPGPAVKKSAEMSPVARAVSSAIAWAVLLLWWTGLLPVASIRPDEVAGVLDGVDYGRILAEVVAAAYWPVTLFAAAKVVFDLMRAASGGDVRLTALGDIGFGAAAAWGLLWLWFWSPLSPVIWVGTVTEFVDRVRDLFDRSAGDGGELATILMMIVVWAFVGEIWRMVRAAGRLVAGK
ncbi:hypothetical protein GCM10017620_10890 [Brevundimonas intermedia]|uniref:DUF2868 domain-containing protein n=1 Tax=Brevundimonas intermedia TaxID=74315 RepID=A0ABQ5T8J6_9CAUL|nr:hypothetical protein [Brevundimonas intermedia]GLK48116.1 hypothetical protein GCM10017620_10890 [Brevundimonas intermedia]